jgi:hypothetical protein
MDELGIAAATGAALVTAMFLLKKLGFVEQWLARERFSRLARVVVRVGQTNEAYFRSLEGMLQTLESLRARTEQAEQRLRSIVAEPADERRMPVRRPKNRHKPKRNSAKQATDRRSRTTGARVAPAAIASAAPSQANKPGRSFPRSEAAVENRAETLSVENKRPRVNGTAE